jgi:hypothetical protein
LPSVTDGYKLTNKMHEEKGLIDSDIVNEWFISQEAMRPGDTKISEVESTLASDISVYSYETPINYKI